MGVNGLWQVISPCARPTNLATLNRKRLAIDASIWIYQFLKAVRDKEGHALRSSHVVGFFRRICKLLWFGVRPVFVFDGAAPALKRQTIANRKRRREGRREDAARTAGKLLAVQMLRRVEEDADSRRRQREERRRREEQQRSKGDGAGHSSDEEPIPDASKLVYAEEATMSRQERQQRRGFHKEDAYHLPDLDMASLQAAGRPEDPRIMSIEELEEYARQFSAGEDVNLYDFSKIDFDGDFFRSLPAADRYNILNAARLRSRLRMGLSKAQLDSMFPDRMAFSRFQIERVKERNRLTQRLMHEIGMTGTDLTINGPGRVAGERNREYILVKNEGAEGGWALGVVSSRDKPAAGSAQKPIDVDELQLRQQKMEEEDDDDEWEDDDDFEDVPIEGLNRLPKIKPKEAPTQEAAAVEEESLFVDSDAGFTANAGIDDLFGEGEGMADIHPEELADINEAIRLSLKTQFGKTAHDGHGAASGSGGGFLDEDLLEYEEETMKTDDEASPPKWEQKAVEGPKPIVKTSGRIVAHIVNNRASAAVPRRRPSNSGSESDEDFGAMLKAARKKKAASGQPARAPVQPNVKNPFDGPLPFEALDWRKSTSGTKEAHETLEKNLEPESDDDYEEAGGFERVEKDPEAPREQPPWLAETTDIREALKQQLQRAKEIDEEDREMAMEEERTFQRRQKEAIIEIDSSDESNDSDVEILEERPAPTSKPISPPPPPPQPIDNATQPVAAGEGTASEAEVEPSGAVGEEGQSLEKDSSSSLVEVPQTVNEPVAADAPSPPLSPDVEFEDVQLPPPAEPTAQDGKISADDIGALVQMHVEQPAASQNQDETAAAQAMEDGIIDDDELEEFSDPEDAELLAQMAEEAEEHARFASELNNKPARFSQEDYEREIKALRNQQRNDRRDADEVTQNMITECQSLLRLFGIPYITAPMEAEAQCAELVRLGLVDGIVTDDSDIFLFGGTRVYKNVFNSNKFVECYLAADIEKDLSLGRAELISLAQLLGSDYAEGLPGVGPVTAVEILSEFPGENGLNEFKKWWEDVQVHGRPKEADAHSPFRKKFRKSQAAKLFLPVGFPSPAVVDAYMKPQVDSNPEEFQWGVPDLELLRQFLMSTVGWSPERTDEVLVPVIKDMNRREIEGTQSNITRYFSGTVGAGARPLPSTITTGVDGDAFAPRQQRAKGSKRMADAVSRLRAKTTTSGAASGETSMSGTDGASRQDADEESAADTGKAGSASAKEHGKRKRKPRARSAVVVDEDDSDGQYVDEADSAQARRQQTAKGKRARVRAAS